jgi:hypothetical protein
MLHDLVQRYTAEQLANEPELEIAARDQHSHYCGMVTRS